MLPRAFAFVIAVMISNVAICNDTLVVKGKVVISVADGVIQCNLTVSNIPKIKNYAFLLNAGMNIRDIRGIQGNSYYYEREYDDHISYEAFQYYIPDNTGKGKYMPGALQFNYVGKFPVIADTATAPNLGDWRGNIAFNGYSLRADGMQSAWYPVLYDIEKGEMFYDVKCDIVIECGDCTTIYMNGNTPVNGTSAHIVNNDANELFLFVGNYQFEKTEENYFLNTDMSSSQMLEFGNLTNEIKKHYEDKLKIRYGSHITYIQSNPTSKNNSWLFVAYPTIVNVGHDVHGMRKFSGADKNWFGPFIAHELAHYYFGHSKRFNSALSDAITEGIAEYLSLNVSRDLLGDSVYYKKVKEKVNKLADFSPVPIAGIKNKDDYQNRELYVYNYVPLIFLAIECDIGERNMWEWLNVILTTDSAHTDYVFLSNTLKKAVSQQKSQLVEQNYFRSDSSLATALKTINSNYPDIQIED